MAPWFPDAKFGIYAHWGPYSVPAFDSEWYSHNMYVNGSTAQKHHAETYPPHTGYLAFVHNFTAPHFNASAWAELYRRAGARYAGPVAEHADGFAMFASEVSHYNAHEMGPKRDVVAEITQAVRSEGLRVVTTLHHQWLWAWYPTWDNYTDCGNASYQLTSIPSHGGIYGPRVGGPGAFSHPNTTRLFQDYFLQKTLEVADNYHPDLIYFDSKWAATIDDDHRLRFLAHYYNSALNRNQSVVVTYKNSDLQPGAGVLDYERGGVADIRTPAWQTDDAMDRHSWSWVEPPSLKPSQELVGELVDIVSKGGNLLLDMPPHADGSIDPRITTTLESIGDWLKINGVAM